MNTKIKYFLRSAVLVSSTLSSVLAIQVAHAEAPELYLGLGYGQYKFEFDDNDLENDFSESKGVIKLFGGGQFTDFIGAEITYLDFDELNDNDLDVEVEGVSLGATLSAPMGDYFSFFAKAGLFKWETSYEDTIALIPVQGEADGTDIFYGIGAKVSLGDQLELRADYDRYELDDDIDPNLDVFSVSAQFNF